VIAAPSRPAGPAPWPPPARPRPARSASLALPKALILVVVLLQRFALPSGALQVPLVLPVAAVLLAVMVAKGVLRPSPHRALAYAVAAGSCLLAAMVSSTANTVSMTSMVFLLVNYAPFCFKARPELARRYVDLVDFFVKVMLVFAVVALAQSLAQLAGVYHYSDVFGSLLPDKFFLSAYNTTNPVRYASPIIRSNAVFFAEPSFLSQFLGLAAVMSLERRNGPWGVVLLVAAMVTTVAGTGFLLLAAGVAGMMLSGRGSALRRFVPAIAAIGIVVLSTGLSNLVSQRASETSRSDSSASSRFTLPYEDMTDSLRSDWETFLVGKGPGAAEILHDETFVKRNVAVVYPVLPKLVIEYGVLGALGFGSFLLLCCFGGARSIPIAFSLFMVHFYLSGALLQPFTIVLFFVFGPMCATLGPLGVQGRGLSRRRLADA
jgi:hypothetical protein